MKIGDKVRFLSETGGGKIAGFRDKNIVLVEDEDGFEVPMQMSEVVVIGEEDYDTRHVVEVKKKNTEEEKQKEKEPADRPITFRQMPEERQGGDHLSAYLAFVPIDIKELTQTRFETYLVNDSNYYLRFTYLSAESGSWQLRATAEVEPNMKLFIEEFGRENLNELERVCIQLLPYKREKSFMLKPAVDVQIRVDAVKFYKLHTFQTNDFFEQPALIYTIIENDQPMNPLVVDAQQMKQIMYAAQHSTKTTPARKESMAKSGDGLTSPIIIDLHIDNLIDSTQGMNAADILNYQLDVFRKTLKEHEKEKGCKIVFIHGKGEGVLRRALINDLQYRFKQYTYQDASFQEYGYGATQVTIK